MSPHTAIILYLCVGAFLYGVALEGKEPDGLAMLMTASMWPLMIVSFIGYEVQRLLDSNREG